MECGLNCCILRNGKIRRKDTNTSVCGHFLEGVGTKKDLGYDMILSWVLFNDADYEIHDE
jgi:hypothetical protein